jgi:homoserine O-acetyltransferase
MSERNEENPMSLQAAQFDASPFPAAVEAPPAPLHDAFACQRGSRQVRITPKYGDGARTVELRYLWTGAPGAPTLIVQGGISADRDVCASPERAVAGWWEPLVGEGKAIDLAHCRVLAIDWLDADALGAPSVSSEDQADALAALLDELGIARALGFAGASYGAMVALAFAARHPQRVGRLLLIAGAHRPHPLASAQRAVQRGILRLGLDSGRTDEALSLARQLAMTTYRGREEFARRFAGGAEWRDGRFRLPVEDWLEHAGERFVARFDARRYLALSESIDLHDIDPAAVRTKAALVGFSSDLLVPLADLCELQRKLGTPASLEAIESPAGHDAFLKEYARLAPIVREFVADCGA